MFNNFFEKSSFLRKNFEKYCRAGWDKMTVRSMRIPSWILKATNTHAEYVILIAFPLQQWLHERDSMLRLYVHCLSLLGN